MRFLDAINSIAETPFIPNSWQKEVLLYLDERLNPIFQNIEKKQ